MRSMIWKSTFREIKESLGRFLAILAIVALGVGFFAGLKVTQPAMLKTAQRYFDKTALYAVSYTHLTLPTKLEV